MENSFPKLSAHNSYHIRQTISKEVNHNYYTNVTIPKLQYTIPSLAELLSNSVVGMELDINSPNAESSVDDFPVYHFPIYDQVSACKTLRNCLTGINEWYINNNRTTSSPLVIYIEPKQIA